MAIRGMLAAVAAAVLCSVASSAPNVTVVSGSLSAPPPLPNRGSEPDAVSFVSSLVGFVGPNDGRLWATADGQKTWHQVGPVRRFRRLDFLTARDGFALLEDGALVGTRNAGRDWVIVHRFTAAPDGASNGESVRFFDLRRGYVESGGRVERTLDGGRRWAPVRTACRGAEPGWIAASFVDLEHGFEACGSVPGAGSQWKELYATDDGGRTWSLRAESSPPGQREARTALPVSGYVGGLDFTNREVGFIALDRGGVAMTADGGRRWRMVLVHSDYWADSFWLDARTGFVLEYADLLTTTDGGLDWRTPPLTVAQVESPTFSSPRDGIALETPDILGRAGLVVASSDGGRNWHPLSTVPGKIDDVTLARASASTVWAVAIRWRPDGGGTIRLLGSLDDGRTWRAVRTFRGADAQLTFASPEVGYLALSSDGSLRSRLYRTIDGGQRWAPVGSQLPELARQTLGFVSSRAGFAVVPSEMSPLSTLLASHDGGRSWRAVGVGPYGIFGAVATVGPADAWVAGSRCTRPGPPCRAVILRTTSAGRTWQLVELQRPLGQTSLDFLSPSLGFMVADNALYRTTDGGRDWILVPSRPPLP
jgi:photosystem II stability/assembly factor-like uncharacterized protein